MHYAAPQRIHAYHVGILCFAAVIFYLAFPRIVTARRASAKANDFSNIRSLGQASLIYASDHNNQLPHASDIWDYMRQLAEGGNLNDADILWSREDPAADSTYVHYISILAPETTGKPRQINPVFRQLKPILAVALGELTATMPVTTPIAWTRSLQLGGTWPKFGPYGNQGGLIVFMGGNVQFFHNLTDDGGRLTRFDGKGKTANILEALPPGTRIGEYTPTPKEQIEWAHALEWRQKTSFFRTYFPPELWLFLAVWAPFVLLAFYRIRQKKANIARVFIWPALLTILMAVTLVIFFPAID